MLKKSLIIGMVLLIMAMASGCSLFTEKGEIYYYDEMGNKVVTDIFEYDSDGKLTAHYELAEE